MARNRKTLSEVFATARPALSDIAGKCMRATDGTLSNMPDACETRAFRKSGNANALTVTITQNAIVAICVSYVSIVASEQECSMACCDGRGFDKTPII